MSSSGRTLANACVPRQPSMRSRKREAPRLAGPGRMQRGWAAPGSSRSSYFAGAKSSDTEFMQ